MGITVSTNMASMNALTNLNRTNRSLSSTLGRISSGSRVLSAADDAAGLAVAENLDADRKSLAVAQRNVNDGISVIQTAEGSASEVGNILKRMRELAVQSSSGTLANSERAYIQDEFTALSSEIDRISSVTEFNGVQLADGSSATVDVQVGIHNTANDRITVTLGDLSATTLGVDAAAMDLSTAAGAQTALGGLDTAIDTVNGYRSGFGAAQNRMESALNNLEVYSQNLASAESQIRDADFAFETAEMTKSQILQQAGVAVLAQANQINSGAVRLLG